MPENQNIKICLALHGLTCNIFGVERIKREREKRLRVGLFPEFGSRVGVPENQRIRRMKSHQKVVGGILIGQPLQVWKCQNSRSGQGHSWNCKFSIIEINTCTTYIFLEPMMSVHSEVLSLTLYWFGSFRELGFSHSRWHVPHYNYPVGVPGGQSKGVRIPQIMVIVFLCPFYL